MCCGRKVGDTTTSEIELEAKFLLKQLLADAPHVEPAQQP